MNEIERAIQEFEDNAYHTSMKPTISEASKAVALRILRAELSRQENAPLTIEDVVSEAYDRGYNLGYSDGYQDGTKGEETE